MMIFSYDESIRLRSMVIHQVSSSDFSTCFDTFTNLREMLFDCSELYRFSPSLMAGAHPLSPHPLHPLATHPGHPHHSHHTLKPQPDRSTQDLLSHRYSRYVTERYVLVTISFIKICTLLLL